MIEIKRHLSAEELSARLREETDPRLKDRLNFIRDVYDGIDVDYAAEKVGYSESTGYNWLHAWNENGIEGLKPDFGGGAPPKLTPREEADFIRWLAEDEPWTTAEIHGLLREEFGVEYSDGHLRRKLESYGMQYSKPLLC